MLHQLPSESDQYNSWYSGIKIDPARKKFQVKNAACGQPVTIVFYSRSVTDKLTPALYSAWYKMGHMDVDDKTRWWQDFDFDHPAFNKSLSANISLSPTSSWSTNCFPRICKTRFSYPVLHTVCDILVWITCMTIGCRLYHILCLIFSRLVMSHLRWIIF